MIIKDLISALMGLEGQHIWPTLSKSQAAALAAAPTAVDADVTVTYTVDPTLDASLADLVQCMLPLAARYSYVDRFVYTRSRFEHGAVSHALAAAMSVLLKEYLVLVAQLEHQFEREALSLQKLWFYVQPAMATMNVLHKIAADASARNLTGGPLLSAIHTLSVRSAGADSNTNELFRFVQSCKIPPLCRPLNPEPLCLPFQVPPRARWRALFRHAEGLDVQGCGGGPLRY